MPRLIWSPSALRDVQRLYRFLAPKNLDAAKRAVSAIRSGVACALQHPYLTWSCYQKFTGSMSLSGSQGQRAGAWLMAWQGHSPLHAQVYFPTVEN